MAAATLNPWDPSARPNTTDTASWGSGSRSISIGILIGVPIAVVGGSMLIMAAVCICLHHREKEKRAEAVLRHDATMAPTVTPVLVDALEDGEPVTRGSWRGGPIEGIAVSPGAPQAGNRSAEQLYSEPSGEPFEPLETVNSETTSMSRGHRRRPHAPRGASEGRRTEPLEYDAGATRHPPRHRSRRPHRPRVVVEGEIIGVNGDEFDEQGELRPNLLQRMRILNRAKKKRGRVENKGEVVRLAAAQVYGTGGSYQKRHAEPVGPPSCADLTRIAEDGTAPGSTPALPKDAEDSAGFEWRNPVFLCSSSSSSRSNSSRSHRSGGSGSNSSSSRQSRSGSFIDDGSSPVFFADSSGSDAVIARIVETHESIIPARPPAAHGDQ